jgi:RNA polymerase sigma-70 factor (ECF subfamily)
MTQSDSAPVALAQQSPVFLTTHWSLVLSAAGEASPAAREALEQLCRAYWYPLYSFARRTGRPPADAQDVTQGFFAYLFEKQLLRRADPESGRFRSFLLGSFKHFLAHEHERATALKRGGGQMPVSLDQLEPEERYSIEPATEASPETLFDRQWAEEQLDRALHRLRDDYASSGRAGLFDLLKDYVWGDKNALTLAEIASRIDLTEEAVKKAVQRLRSRFRECLREEIAQTVATPDQIDEELRHLRAALGN